MARLEKRNVPLLHQKDLSTYFFTTDPSTQSRSQISPEYLFSVGLLLSKPRTGESTRVCVENVNNEHVIAPTTGFCFLVGTDIRKS